MHRKVAAALVAALALGVASCGSSSEPLTRAELVSQVETACRQAQREAQAKARSIRGPDAFIAAILASQEGLNDRIDDLEPPAALSDAFDTYKAEISARIDVLTRFQDAGGLRDRAAAADVEREMTAITRRLEGTATTLGVRGCL